MENVPSWLNFQTAFCLATVPFRSSVVPLTGQWPVIGKESDPQADYNASNSKAGTDCPTKHVHGDWRYASSRSRWRAVADVYFLLTASEQSLQLFVYHRVLCQTFASEWDGKTELRVSQRRGLVPTSVEITENAGPLGNRWFSTSCGQGPGLPTKFKWELIFFEYPSLIPDFHLYQRSPIWLGLRNGRSSPQKLTDHGLTMDIIQTLQEVLDIQQIQIWETKEL